MLTSVHILLSMRCNYECDHCFLYCSPRSPGTFTTGQLDDLYDQMKKLPDINSVYFEGGEPFLYYPLLLQGLEMARERGYKRGIVSNGYWANSTKDAELWLAPIAEIGLNDLSISDDSLHHGEEEGTRSRRVKEVAQRLHLPAGSICLEPPTTKTESTHDEKGQPIVGGDIRFRGRAIEKFAEGLPVKLWREFDQCPDEDLVSPSRVHVDSYGYVHLCQGLCIGNIWETPLDELMANYNPNEHPICKHLIQGGPAALARAYDFHVEEGYIDACHLCFSVRRSLLDRFPDALAPKQVYGDK